MPSPLNIPASLGLPVAAAAVLFACRRWICLAIFRTLERKGKGVGENFLSGNFAPVDKEVHAEDLPTEGTVPKELEGWYMRTGPNPQFPPNGGYHWFDGEGMVHSVVFEDGKAKSYSNHWVQCPLLLEERKAGKNQFMRFGDTKGIRGLIMLLIKEAIHLYPKGAPEHQTGSMGNTSVQYHAQRLLALNEGAVPFELRMLCRGLLESIGAVTFDGKLNHEFTAHPKIEPVSGVMHGLAYNFKKAPHLVYFSVSAKGEKSESVPIDVRSPAMFHDFAISSKYAIFPEHNLLFQPENMVKKKTGPISTNLDQPGRIGLLKLDAPSEPVMWFEVGPYVFFHCANGWDEGDLTHIVVCEFLRGDTMTCQLDDDDLIGEAPDKTDSYARPFAVRYTVNTKTKETSRTVLVPDQAMDFPVVAPQMVGRPARYCWAGMFDRILIKGIIKVDMKASEGKGRVAQIDFPPNVNGGEFVFVPRDGPALERGQAEEDDGFLVGYVTDSSTMTSYCMVYDAKTMSATPLAKITLPQRVPWGFHGTFVPKSQLPPLQPALQAAQAV